MEEAFYHQEGKASIQSEKVPTIARNKFGQFSTTEVGCLMNLVHKEVSKGCRKDDVEV